MSRREPEDYGIETEIGRGAIIGLSLTKGLSSCI